MPAEIIAVANHKGGVNKTTTAVALSTGLAFAQWRTLLVDCDAQGNTTSMFIRRADDWDGPEEQDDGIEYDLYDVIAGGTPAEQAIVETRVPGLHLLPSSLDVSRLDQELFVKHKREEQVRRHLASVLDRYDAIILDLAPNLGALVISALCAADSLIVPTDATRWGYRGVQMFMGWAQDLRDEDVLRADVLGVLLTKYEGATSPGTDADPSLARTRASRMTLQALRESEYPMFGTLIPKRTAAERMVEEMALIGDPGADPDLSEAYALFTREVIERVRAAQEQRGRHARGA